ncbi:MAG: universal stress protein [Chitinophagaceae bacterium]|nr:universal stress protein [Chitinophagaceae bacterium]HMN31766.1 universal stress protein [Chitinophagaceae bacterium]
MLNFKNLLCPTDFSAESKEAIRYAVKMGNQSQTVIHLIHTLEAPIVMDSNSAMYYQKMIDTLNASAENDMNNLLAELREKYSGYQFTGVVKDNADSAESIVEFAKSIEAEAIIMSSHGRRGIKRLLMGSVTESVMRLSDIPVVIIRHQNKK